MAKNVVLVIPGLASNSSFYNSVKLHMKGRLYEHFFPPQFPDINESFCTAFLSGIPSHQTGVCSGFAYDPLLNKTRSLHREDIPVRYLLENKHDKNLWLLNWPGTLGMSAKKCSFVSPEFLIPTGKRFEDWFVPHFSVGGISLEQASTLRIHPTDFVIQDFKEIDSISEILKKDSLTTSFLRFMSILTSIQSQFMYFLNKFSSSDGVVLWPGLLILKEIKKYHTSLFVEIESDILKICSQYLVALIKSAENFYLIGDGFTNLNANNQNEPPTAVVCSNSDLKHIQNCNSIDTLGTVLFCSLGYSSAASDGVELNDITNLIDKKSSPISYKAQEFFIFAEQLRANGQHTSAFELYQRAYDLIPNSPLIAFRLFISSVQNGELDYAKELLNQFHSYRDSVEYKVLKFYIDCVVNKVDNIPNEIRELTKISFFLQLQLVHLIEVTTNLSRAHLFFMSIKDLITQENLKIIPLIKFSCFEIESSELEKHYRHSLDNKKAESLRIFLLNKYLSENNLRQASNYLFHR